MHLVLVGRSYLYTSAFWYDRAAISISSRLGHSGTALRTPVRKKYGSFERLGMIVNFEERSYKIWKAVVCIVEPGVPSPEERGIRAAIHCCDTLYRDGEEEEAVRSQG